MMNEWSYGNGKKIVPTEALKLNKNKKKNTVNSSKKRDKKWEKIENKQLCR